eukprot:TRINITY_DN7178_c0_g1_i2.p2 TRINITY_DN7178_c0_g1~~TRINITY_DN7178_c0_g1_i2.p2  ORF type:complete len:182 (+),score=2.67 TRINITY_DN7178_c0_g1_i2:191-736(+)
MIQGALRIIVDFLEGHDIEYMIFGGIANSIHGISRQTFDIDIKIALQVDALDAVLGDLATVGAILPDNPIDFVHDTSVLPVQIEDVRVDLVFAWLPYEFDAITRSKRIHVLDCEARVCTPEDLIIQKCISERERDWMDIEGVVQTMKNDLDWDFILTECGELSSFIADSTIMTRLERLANA